MPWEILRKRAFYQRDIVKESCDEATGAARVGGGIHAFAKAASSHT
jgi:hypothetical protein